MNKAAGLITGAAIGAVAMYFLDPDRGRRRRAVVRDKAVHVINVKRDALGKMQRDTANKARGLWCEAKSRFTHDDADDQVLAERIRSQIGRRIRHPGGVEVEVKDGCACLRGPVLAGEVEDLISCVERVRGVKRVENQLELHELDDGVPALQGQGRVGHNGADLFSDHWRPSTSLVMGVAGGALTLYGAMRRDRAGAALSTMGMSLLLRSFKDMEGKRLLDLDGQQNKAA